MELGGKRQLLRGSNAAERHVRALLIVSPWPAGSCVLHLLDRPNKGRGKPCIAHRLVVALDGRRRSTAAFPARCGRFGCRAERPSQQGATVMYSGPLSQRLATSLPRHSLIRFRARITRAESSNRSTSIPSPSQLKSFSTLNRRKLPRLWAGRA